MPHKLCNSPVQCNARYRMIENPKNLMLKCNLADLEIREMTDFGIRHKFNIEFFLSSHKVQSKILPFNTFFLVHLGDVISCLFRLEFLRQCEDFNFRL